nr:MAG TPA: hypothetical protein [Bacteriophage sp.]
MTVQYYVDLIGTKEYETSAGDTLYKIQLKLYSSYKEQYTKVLTELNPGVIWYAIPAGTVITYIPLEGVPDV